MFSWKWLRAFRFQFKKKKHTKTINLTIAIGQTSLGTGWAGRRRSDRLPNAPLIQRRLETSRAGSFTIKGERLACNQGLKLGRAHRDWGFAGVSSSGCLRTPKRKLFPRSALSWKFWRGHLSHHGGLKFLRHPAQNPAREYPLGQPPVQQPRIHAPRYQQQTSCMQN